MQRTLCFIFELQHIRGVSSSQGDSIIIFGTLQDFREAGQVDAQGHRSVTAVECKPLRTQIDSHKCDVRVVHRLELDAVLGALKVGICDKLLDSYAWYSVMGSTKKESETLLVGSAWGREDERFTVNETLKNGGLVQLSFEHDRGLFFGSVAISEREEDGSKTRLFGHAYV